MLKNSIDVYVGLHHLVEAGYEIGNVAIMTDVNTSSRFVDMAILTDKFFVQFIKLHMICLYVVSDKKGNLMQLGKYFTVNEWPGIEGWFKNWKLDRFEKFYDESLHTKTR
jgi:hypothetical protein